MILILKLDYNVKAPVALSYSSFIEFLEFYEYLWTKPLVVPCEPTH